MWDLTIHPHLRLSVLAGTRILLQSTWDPPIHSPLWPSIFADTLPGVHPLWGSTSSLVHRPVSGLDTIRNSPSSPLVDIVLFGLSLSSFPNASTRERFHTFIKNRTFRSPLQPTWNLTATLMIYTDLYLFVIICQKTKKLLRNKFFCMNQEMFLLLIASKAEVDLCYRLNTPLWFIIICFSSCIENHLLCRYMGTITGISDLDPVRWKGSQWRNLQV